MSNDLHKKVVTRIAPSPTGSFHIGTARTALFNYLFAKKHSGKFLVRFEDTDKERSDKRYEKEILDALSWLSMKPDRIERQSRRTKIYETYIKRLLDEEKAFVSKEKSKKDPNKEVEVIRFRNVNSKVSFFDTLRGNIEIDISELGNFVIARSINDPLYNLAVVIDDIEMGVTHILRGDDHIINTPRQVVLMEALKAPLPEYTHIPLIHGTEGGKLSKRKDSASINTFKEQGYLPEALLNTIALLGWNPKNNRELFSEKELTQEFSLENIQKKEAIFDERKLQWFHKQYVQKVEDSYLRTEIVPTIIRRFPLRSRLNPRGVRATLYVARQRGAPFSEERKMVQDGAYDFYFVRPKYKATLLIPKGEQVEDSNIKHIYEALNTTKDLLTTLNAHSEWSESTIREALWPHAEKIGKSLVLWPLRVSLTGKEKSQDPFSICHALGKKETLARIKNAMHILQSILKNI